ncbi:hypothetical protein JB92DRAFT_2836297 [Gautieria morchelliformis]|nr:hypothetical protein JB92DRAFT_2836297 [Gautieria morchelliformis]
MAQIMQTDKELINLVFLRSRDSPIQAYDKVLNAEYPDPRRCRTMRHGALLSIFPLAASKDLKLLQRPDIKEQILIKFHYIDNFNKDEKDLPDVSAEDLENIEELLEDGVNMELGKSSLARKRLCLHLSEGEDHADKMLGQPRTVLYQRTRQPHKEPTMPSKPQSMKGSGRQRPAGTIAPHGHMQITDNLGDAQVPGAWTASKRSYVKNSKAALVDVWVQPLTLLKTGRLDVRHKEAREILM